MDTPHRVTFDGTMTHPVNEKIVGLHVGIFSVSEELVKYHSQAVLDFFHKEGILPVKAEMSFISNSVDYVAFGMNFEPVPMGRIPYHYMLHVEMEAVEDVANEGHLKTQVKSLELRRFN